MERNLSSQHIRAGKARQAQKGGFFVGYTTLPALLHRERNSFPGQCHLAPGFLTQSGPDALSPTPSCCFVADRRFEHSSLESLDALIRGPVPSKAVPMHNFFSPRPSRWSLPDRCRIKICPDTSESDLL